ncbi:hypothetical protein HAX54_017462, partial [Datura stramonium]|nr:hypothetical protein [Datura stramonium]
FSSPSKLPSMAFSSTTSSATHASTRGELSSTPGRSPSSPIHSETPSYTPASPSFETPSPGDPNVTLVTQKLRLLFPSLTKAR